MTTLTKQTKFRLPAFYENMIIPVLVFFICMGSTASFSQEYYENFDDGDYEGWHVQGPQNCLSTEYSLSGKYSFRAQLSAKRSGNPRHEMVFSGNNGISQNFDWLKTYSVSFAMYIPSNFKADHNSKDLIMQFHQESDNHDTYYNPLFVTEIRGNDIGVVARWIKTDPGHLSSQETTSYDVGKVSPGKWHYFVIEVNWDYRSSGNGYAKVYFKVGSAPSSGDLKVHHNDPIGSKDKIGPYFKMGVYKFDWKHSSIVNKALSNGITEREYFFDNVTVKKGTLMTSSSGGSDDDNSSSSGSGDLTVSAGSDFSVPVKDKNFDIDGSWDSDKHNVKSVQWKKISGPGSVESNMDRWRCHISSINEGEYVYEIKIIDDKNNSATDRVKITVHDGSGSGSGSGSSSSSGDDEGDSDTSTSQGGLTVSAGPDFNVSVDERNFDIDGSWDSKKFDVKSVQWTNISGPGAHETNMDNWRCHISSIKEGVYVYEIKIVDNNGNVATDRARITVYDGAPPSGGGSDDESEPAPNTSDLSVSAGSDFSVSESDRNFNLDAQWDSDKHNVKSVQWKKISGPGCVETNMDNWRCHISSINEGAYVFEVKIVDDKNNVATDRVKVTVVDGPVSGINSSDEFSDFMPDEFTMGLTRNFITGDNGIHLIDQQYANETLLQLLNINGQSLQSSYNDGFLNTNTLSPGVYIYNVVNPEGELVQKGRIIRK